MGYKPLQTFDLRIAAETGTISPQPLFFSRVFKPVSWRLETQRQENQEFQG